MFKRRTFVVRLVAVLGVSLMLGGCQGESKQIFSTPETRSDQESAHSFAFEPSQTKLCAFSRTSASSAQQEQKLKRLLGQEQEKRYPFLHQVAELAKPEECSELEEQMQNVYQRLLQDSAVDRGDAKQLQDWSETLPEIQSLRGEGKRLFPALLAQFLQMQSLKPESAETKLYAYLLNLQLGRAIVSENWEQVEGEQGFLMQLEQRLPALWKRE